MGCRSLYLKRPILPQNEMTALPNPDLIYDLFGGIFKPQFIRTALQLDVFTPLAQSPFTAEQIAQACGCDTTGIKILIDYLYAAQLLTFEDNRYPLTLDAATFLVRGRKAYAGDMILDYTDPVIYASIAQSIRSGQPKWLNVFDRRRIAPVSRFTRQSLSRARRPRKPRLPPVRRRSTSQSRCGSG